MTHPRTIDVRGAADETIDVLLETLDERLRQDIRWGEQNHPDLDQVLLNRPGGCTPKRMAEEYEIPTAQRAQSSCEIAFGRGQGTWAHILVEEVAEAIGAPDAVHLRAELIQVAAVAVAWIEAIDRRHVASGDRWVSPRPVGRHAGPEDAA